MSLFEYENSRDRGQPVEAFEFSYGEGAGDVYRYTDAEMDLTVPDVGTFISTPIHRADSAKTKGRPKGTDLKIEIPASTELAGLFRGLPPRRMIFVRIYQGHIPNTSDPGAWTTNTFRLFWSGRILESARRQGGLVQLSCDTLGAGMKRPGLKKFYQRTCQVQLYGPYCNADKGAATEADVVVDSVSGDVIGLPTGWNGTRGVNDFVGGLVEWTGPYGLETRLIVDPSENAVVLDTPATDLAALDTINLILGCPHTLAACTDLHNNTVNYQGFPWIPRKNPINKNNHT